MCVKPKNVLNFFTTDLWNSGACVMAEGASKSYGLCNMKTMWSGGDDYEEQRLFIVIFNISTS